MKTVKYPDIFRKEDIHVDKPIVRDRKIEALIEAMTMEEKFSLLGGSKEPEDKGKIGNAGYQWGVPRLGIPEAVMYDGPAGITGVVETTGLPQPALLGCTWDDEMAYNFGKVAASEAAVCSGNYLLAPQVDVIRTPHFGRNKDMKSEDSYLAGRMAVAETKGCQDQGVVATIKHFAVANTFGRSFFNFPNEMVDEQTLHEQYCRTFEMAIREGDAGSVMNSYNKVNGAYASANPGLLKDILRDQWGYRGSVMSDWGSVHEFTMDKGMDMEMPYPAYNNTNRILKHIRKGDMSFEDVDEIVRHVLYGMSAAGLLGLVQLDEDGKVLTDPYHTQPIQMEWRYEKAQADGLFERNAQLAAKIVEEGTVLLKNNGALPLAKESLQGKVALIGLGSKYPVTGDQQERSFGTIRRMQSGKEALEEVTGRMFDYAVGIDYVGEAIPAECFYQDEACEKAGLVRTYGILDEDRDPLALQEGPGGAGGAFMGFSDFDEDGVPIDTGMASYNDAGEKHPEDYPLGQLCCVDGNIDFTVGRDENGNLVKTYQNGPDGKAFKDQDAFTWKGFLKAPESGEYTLLLECIGGMASFFIQIDGKWIQAGKSAMREWAQWPWESLICTREGMGITGTKVQLGAGKVYPVLVHARQCVRNKDLQIRTAWQTPSFARKNYEEAMKLASEADTVIYYACENVMAGLPFGKIAERQPLEYSGEQKQLMMDVFAAKKPEAKLIVIAQTSNARALGEWADKADAILTAYHPGQEGARVVAKILTGQINPSGKLSQTWPARSQDTPVSDSEAHLVERGAGSEPDSDGYYEVRMSEGIFTGYRYYDEYGIKPLFPFGHGLSYTSFEYSDLEVEEFTDEQNTDFGSTFKVRLNVTNTGAVAGDEIVQIYLGRAAEVPAGMQMAKKQLVGYQRVKDLAPGAVRTVEIDLDPRMLCSWDSGMSLKTRSDGTKDKWRRMSGKRVLMAAASSEDIRLCTEIEV